MEDIIDEVFSYNVDITPKLPLILKSVGHRTISRPGLMVPFYKSYSIIFTWLVRGSVKAVIDGVKYDFKSSCLMVVLPGSTCEVFLERGMAEGWRLAVEGEGAAMDSLISDMGLWSGVFPARNIPVSRLANIMQYADQQTYNDSLRAIENARGIIMHAANDCDNCASDKWVHRAMKIIMAEWRNPELNVNFIASRLKIHRSTLTSRFKKNRKCTVLEMIHKKRFHEVIQQLLNNSMSINEIASASGFRDANYMIRLFKQRHGCTPGDFRRDYELNISI